MGERFLSRHTGTPQGPIFAPNAATPSQRGTSVFEAWYSNVVNQTAYATGAEAIDLFRIHPFNLGLDGVLDRLAFEVTTGGAAGSVGRAGLYGYTSDRNYYPTSLIVDGGEFDCTTIAIKAATISVGRRGGFFWVASNMGVAAPSTRRFAAGGYNTFFGIAATMGATMNANAFVASTYAALPATAPGSIAVGVGAISVLHVRYSQ